MTCDASGGSGRFEASRRSPAVLRHCGVVNSFFSALDRLHATSRVIIDRPEGSTHPQFSAVRYPINYGYLEGTTGGDGAGVDVFVGSATGAGVVAAAVTVDLVRRDAELKVLADCSAAEVEAVAQFLRDTLGLGVQLIQR